MCGVSSAVEVPVEGSGYSVIRKRETYEYLVRGETLLPRVRRDPIRLRDLRRFRVLGSWFRFRFPLRLRDSVVNMKARPFPAA